jgi:benzoyl-CoA reductase subunit C
MSVSTVNDVLDRFRHVTEKPYEKLHQWKETNNRKIVGCSPMHFPEELVHAAGMLPVVLQETDETITEGFSYVHPFFCGITRNIIDMAAKGQLNFFDGLVFSDICIQNRNAALTLRQIMPESSSLDLVQFPTFLTRSSIMEDTMRELGRVKESMARISGREIDDSSLEQSILVFNQDRSLLRRLHDLCMKNPGLMSFRDRQIVVRAGMLMPKEEHSKLLTALIAGLSKVNPASMECKRIFLSGHLCQGPKIDILGLIEGTGGLIVDDDLYTGYRYYGLDVAMNGSPVENLAKRFLERDIPVPTRSDGRIRWDQYVAERAKNCDAQGVIVLIAKYCEPHLFHYPFIKKALKGAGIPHLMLETEHELVSLEGMKTRLQAFMEMLG